jgi:hypothetical protein
MKVLLPVLLLIAPLPLLLLSLWRRRTDGQGLTALRRGLFTAALVCHAGSLFLVWAVVLVAAIGDDKSLSTALLDSARAGVFTVGPIAAIAGAAFACAGRRWSSEC